MKVDNLKPSPLVAIGDYCVKNNVFTKVNMYIIPTDIVAKMCATAGLSLGILLALKDPEFAQQLILSNNTSELSDIAFEGFIKMVSVENEGNP